MKRTKNTRSRARSNKKNINIQQQSFSPIGLLLFVVIFAGIGGYVLLRSFSAAPSSIYVSPNGNDSNSGTQSSPYRTIQKAVNSAGAGTTVHVAAGSYSPITINNSGTASAPLVIISDTKWGAKISGSGNGTTKSYIVRNNGSYVHVIGFDMTGTGITNGVDNFGSHNLIQGNHVHNMTNINCSGTPGGSGLGDDTGSYNTYDSNVVNNFGDYPNKCDYVHAIYVDDDGDVVSNNIAYNNVGNGLYTNHGTGKVIFTNNLSFANKEYGVGVNGSGSGNVVQNNILIGNGIAGIKTWSGTSNTQIQHNIFYNNATNTALDGSATQSGNSTADPGLVNYQSNGTGDYHLKAGSIAIDAGVSTNAPSNDIDGHTRPVGKAVDIGPYEYGSTGTAPSPTPTPTPTPTPSPTPTPKPSPSPTPKPSPSPTPTPTPSGGTPSPTPSGSNNNGQTSGDTTQGTTSGTTSGDTTGQNSNQNTAGNNSNSLGNILSLTDTGLPICQDGQTLGHKACSCSNGKTNSSAAICTASKVANPIVTIASVIAVVLLSLRVVQTVRLSQRVGFNEQYTPLLRKRVLFSAIGIMISVLICLIVAYLLPGGLLNR